MWDWLALRFLNGLTAQRFSLYLRKFVSQSYFRKSKKWRAGLWGFLYMFVVLLHHGEKKHDLPVDRCQIVTVRW